MRQVQPDLVVAPQPFLDRIRHKLLSELVASDVILTDDSARHRGHREAAGRLHLKLRIVSARFSGLSRLERHRLVYEVLSEELAGPIHALNVVALTPEDAAAP